MTREEITSMAEEAGFKVGAVTGAIYAPTTCEKELIYFAHLVAKTEREACAKLCEQVAQISTADAHDCAAAIRLRGFR